MSHNIIKQTKISDSDLITRYKKELDIPENIKLTSQMVYQHLDLEIKLADQLRQSSGKNRWEIAKKCYTKFYTQLNWLSKYAGKSNKTPIEIKEEAIINIIGKSPKKIYEIGSGKGELLLFLAENGHQCRGCDLYEKRGVKQKFVDPNLSRGLSDGVHLDRFEPPYTYDVLISNNVFEHLHPDDAVAHFKSAHRILKKGGQYILKTPHGFYGPHGIEKIFGFVESIGFHLKEYTYSEIYQLAKSVNFKTIRAIFVLPIPLKRMISKSIRFNNFKTERQFFIRYLIFIEDIYKLYKNRHFKSLFRQGIRYLFFPRQVFVVMQK